MKLLFTAGLFLMVTRSVMSASHKDVTGTRTEAQALASLDIPQDFKADPAKSTELSNLIRKRSGAAAALCDGADIFSDEELSFLRLNRSLFVPTPEALRVMQYRVAKGLEVLKKVFDQGNYKDKFNDVCLSTSFSEPTLDGALSIPWNANEDEIRAALNKMPSKDHLEAKKKEVNTLVDEIQRRHGVRVYTDADPRKSKVVGFYSSVPLLKSLDAALSDPSVSDLRFANVILGTFPTPKKSGYVGGAELEKSGLGLTSVPVHLSGLVILNSGGLKPEDIKQALIQSGAPKIPDQAMLDKLEQMAKADKTFAPALLEQRDRYLKDRTKLSRALYREQAMAKLDRGVGFESPNFFDEAELKLLRQVNQIPVQEFKPGSGLVSPRYGIQRTLGSRARLNEWVLGSSSTGNITFSREVDREEILKAQSSIPSQSKFESQLQKLSGLEKEILRMGSSLMISDRESMTFREFEQRMTSLAAVKTYLSERKPDLKGKYILSDPKKATGPKVWLQGVYIHIAEDASESDLDAFFRR